MDERKPDCRLTGSADRRTVEAMAKGDDPKPRRVKCGACFGEGGTWEELNGDKGQERVWKPCRACGGSGYVDA